MRKTLYLLLSACCLATAVLFGAPIRSSLGAAGAEYVEEDAALPTDYITDGLVAYFDALENEDWGVYNPLPSFWKDLTGNGFDLPLDGTAVSFNNGVCTVPAGTTVNSGKALDAVSIEVVWRIGKKSPYVREKVLHTGTTRGVMIRYKAIGFKVSNPLNCIATIGDDSRFSYGSYSFIYNRDFSWANIYLNGAMQTGTKVSMTTTDLSGMGITTSADIVLYVSCIRIYDRVLTEEEVEWNYNIDRERFDLP